MASEKHVDIRALEDILLYTFKDKTLLIEALTHSSYANESRKKNISYNERLEFLGDSVLNISTSDYLFRKYTDYPEGELTKIRGAVVSESSLYRIAKKMDLGRFLLLGKGEESTGGRRRSSVLADAFEAVIGAIYLDGGFESAKSFVQRMLLPAIKDALEGKQFHDYKTELQELVQQDNKELVYTIIDERGPDHNKLFTVQVSCNNKVLGVGRGRSKKESEQNAAKNALNSNKIKAIKEE